MTSLIAVLEKENIINKKKLNNSPFMEMLQLNKLFEQTYTSFLPQVPALLPSENTIRGPR